MINIFNPNTINKSTQLIKNKITAYTLVISVTVLRYLNYVLADSPPQGVPFLITRLFLRHPNALVKAKEESKTVPTIAHPREFIVLIKTEHLLGIS